MLAYDRDAKRLARLKANAKAAAASNVKAELADFLSLPLATDPRFRYRTTFQGKERQCLPSVEDVAQFVSLTCYDRN